MTGKFEVYQDKTGKHRFRLKLGSGQVGSGQVVAVGEAYPTKDAAKSACEQVRRAADGAAIEEVDA